VFEKRQSQNGNFLTIQQGNGSLSTGFWGTVPYFQTNATQMLARQASRDSMQQPQHLMHPASVGSTFLAAHVTNIHMINGLV
jgi:hypothetical protein